MFRFVHPFFLPTVSRFGELEMLSDERSVVGMIRVNLTEQIVAQFNH